MWKREANGRLVRRTHTQARNIMPSGGPMNGWSREIHTGGISWLWWLEYDVRFRRVQCGCADQSTSSDPSCWQPRSGWGWPIEHTSSVWPVPLEPTTHPPSNQHTPHAQHYSLIHLTTERESLTSTKCDIISSMSVSGCRRHIAYLCKTLMSWHWQLGRHCKHFQKETQNVLIH